METQEKKSVKPPRLKPRDTIGIVAPAGPFDPEIFMKGTAILKSMGFRTVFDEMIFQKRGFLAGTDVQRADQVNRLFADSTIQAVACARGGYGSMRILRFLDFETIQNNPKIFVGFSDISVLLSVLHDRCDLVTFHGPVVTTLADADQETVAAMQWTMTSDTPMELAPENGVVVRPGLASGPVAGGNLTTLCHLVGTPYAPSFKGKILLLEDLGEAPYRIDRMLTQMKLAGCFNGIAGLILGSFKECGFLSEIYALVGDFFEDMEIPLMAGFEIGHGRRNLTIPFGLEATLDTEKERLLFHEPAVGV
jgi:muramoyltetrapeptide carboxypeptidase